MLSGLGVDGVAVYEEDFENEFLATTRAFYRAESQVYYQHSIMGAFASRTTVFDLIFLKAGWCVCHSWLEAGWGRMGRTHLSISYVRFFVDENVVLARAGRYSTYHLLVLFLRLVKQHRNNAHLSCWGRGLVWLFGENEE